MREIVLDTETTGLDPGSGDRVVEIACLELVNHLPTGQVFQTYLNPERDMPEGAYQVHGLSADFLSEHPLFAQKADAFLDFIADSPLVIHNAEFDMRFLNAELDRIGRAALEMERTIDTVRLARRKFPGAQANLDALCKRFGIDNSARAKHGALLDAELLAEVYLELIGGREPGLTLASAGADTGETRTTPVARAPRAPRPHAPSAVERAAHAAFLEKIDDPIWRE
ncbi:MAG: DNA polymerase III subunit epsilon [Alphaproteobacteria bacterium]